jgi:hypothetical protein
MGIGYERASIRHQRAALRRLLADRLPMDKLGRLAYFREMERTRSVLLPFGLGEITLKDFEVFLTGSLLIKPDMSHLETWPDFYRDGETFVGHAWIFPTSRRSLPCTKRTRRNGCVSPKAVRTSIATI